VRRFITPVLQEVHYHKFTIANPYSLAGGVYILINITTYIKIPN